MRFLLFLFDVERVVSTLQFEMHIFLNGEQVVAYEIQGLLYFYKSNPGPHGYSVAARSCL